MKSKVLTINRYFIIKSIFVCLFLIYTFIVIDFTLINDSFGRSISNIFSADKTVVTEYLLEKTNFVPFATVKLFLNAYRDANLEPYIVVENILGNFFVFMPFAFLVPIVFKKVNSVLKFFVFISVCVLLIETLQIIFLTGSADIDDFILNVSGAMATYVILQIPVLKKVINKFIFGEADEN